MVQKDDDVLDYGEAVIKLSQATMVIEEGGSHAFERAERYFDKIRVFFQ